MTMDFERVRVTGETKQKFKSPATDVAENIRVSDAVVEPSVAEQLEVERAEKAMRGEEVVSAIEEEREPWPVMRGEPGGGRGSIKRSQSSLKKLIASTRSEKQPSARKKSRKSSNSSSPAESPGTKTSRARPRSGSARDTSSSPAPTRRTTNASTEDGESRSGPDSPKLSPPSKPSGQPPGSS